MDANWNWIGIAETQKCPIFSHLRDRSPHPHTPLNFDSLLLTGHGSRVRDQDGDEDDGFDETLVPVDFQRNGQIRDDDIFKVLVKPLRSGVTMTCLMDCCHSGTVLDLPYRFTADGDVMQRNDRFQLFDSPEGVMAAACCLFALLSCLLDG